MKGKVVAALLAGLLLAIAVGTSLLVKQTGQVHTLQQENRQATAQVRRLKDNQTNLESQLKAAKKQQATLEKQAPKVPQTNDETSDVRKRYSEVSNTLFQALYTFNPESFKTRRTQVKDYLSDELIKQFFPAKSYVETANNVTSKLDHVDVYNRAIQGDHVDGLVVVYYESKQGDNDFKKSVDAFQVSYQPESEKFTKMQSLGIGLPVNTLNEDT